MLTIIICVLILCLCIGALAFFFGPTDERAFVGLWACSASLSIAFIVGVVFVAAHFISKYW